MLICTISGIEYRLLRDFVLVEQIGNKTSTTVKVAVDDPATQPFPVAGDVIQITDSETGQTLFWGQCGIPSSPQYATGHEQHIYSITCSNANSVLSNRIANVAYQDRTVSYIVNDLYNRYIAAEGVSLGTISDIDVTISIYTAADFNLQNCLDELANLVSACWNIDNSRQFNFIRVDEFASFPAVIDSSFLLGTALQHKTIDYKTRTVQYVSGGYERTKNQVEQFTYTDQTSFTLSFPLIMAPRLYVDDGTAAHEVSQSLIGVAGLSDDDEEIIFKWSYNSQNITYDETSEYLSPGDVLIALYVGQFPIRVKVMNDSQIAAIAKKTGLSGLRESVLIDKTVQSQDDAYNRASALLQQFETATHEVRFWLLSSDLDAAGFTLDSTALLTKMTFNLPELGVVGDYVITERKVSPYFADVSDYAEKLKISLVLKNRDFMKSSAETISNLRKSVDNLSFREDDIVIDNAEQYETKALTETMEYESSDVLVYYPSDSLTGPIFSFQPMDQAFPIIDENWYASEYDEQESLSEQVTLFFACPLYPSTGSDTFSPLPIGNAYPVYA